MKIRNAVLIGLLCSVGFLATGCNALSTAQGFERVINGVLAIAEADYPSLPVSDQAIMKQWVNLGVTLDTQLQTCIAGVNSSKASSFAICFTSFAGGLTSSTELAQLRLLSPAAQSKATLWATAAILGVNAALTWAKAADQPLPQIAANPANPAQLAAIRRQVAPAGY